MEQFSVPRRCLVALLCSLFACGFAIAQASPSIAIPEKTLDQKIDDLFGKKAITAWIYKVDRVHYS